VKSSNKESKKKMGGKIKHYLLSNLDENVKIVEVVRSWGQELGSGVGVRSWGQELGSFKRQNCEVIVHKAHDCKSKTQQSSGGKTNSIDGVDCVYCNRCGQ
jgi:hypothetical protein